jgi:hypothetical protein
MASTASEAAVRESSWSEVASVIAAQDASFADPSRLVRAALVNGAAGVVITADGRPVSVMGFTVSHGKIVEIDAFIDPERLSRLGLADFGV